MDSERFYFDRPYYYSAKSLGKIFGTSGMEIKDDQRSYRPTVDPSELQ